MKPIVVASFASKVHARAIAILAAAGCTVREIPAGTPAWTAELIEEYAPSADAWLGTFPGLGIPRSVLERSMRARLVVSQIIGTEFIDVDAATELGILVAHGAMAENFDGMAEAGVMLIAALRKQLMLKAATIKEGGWKPAQPGSLVSGATIGLFGLGRIGRGVARRLSGWDANILAYDPHVTSDRAAEVGVTLVSLDDLLQRSDVVVVMVPLTDETRNMIDAMAIARMKRGAQLVSIGRGGCVDEAALLCALNDGRLSGAALDVWEVEPPPVDHLLRNHPKVIATGHVIGHSEELYARIPQVAADNVLLGLRGEVPLHVRNPEVLPAWQRRIAALVEQAGEAA
jgi:D-3-phosphoglycerate dehydrogenase / 2-oxoglutarate reductase